MTTKIENYDWDTEFQKIRRERDSHRYFHVTKNGDRIRLKHLTDSHLNNIIAMIERKEKTAKNRWVYNYSYTISILGQFPLIPNAGTNCRVIDQKNWENILKNSRHWHKKL